MPRYNPATIEPKWQKYWEENRTFATPRLPKGPKIYVLDMFPYPSGDGLHVGHPEGYTATDIVCRYRRMRGCSVMHPMGWDAFGLPAEQHAKRTGAHPRSTTEKNIATFRRQLKMLGFSYDWQRELATTEPDYFRWTQFIFLVLFDTWFDAAAQRGRPIAELPIPEDVAEQGDAAAAAYRDQHRLAYQLEAAVNWCPALGTVLANEEVQGGVSERGGHPVVRMPLRQWMLRITAYADRLERDLDGLDWPEGIKLLAAQLDRPQHRGGSGFLHRHILGGQWKTVAAGISGLARGSPRGRLPATARRERAADLHDPGRHALRGDLHGDCPGASAFAAVDRPRAGRGRGRILPAGGPQERPRPHRPGQGEDRRLHWLLCDQPGQRRGDSDLGGRLRAHQLRHRRDHGCAGARHPRLRFCQAIRPADSRRGRSKRRSGALREDLLAGRVAFIADGTAVNSGPYDGLPTAEFKKRIVADLQSQGQGRPAVNYKLRDWLFSRQHFWGEPFPILHELDAEGRPNGRIRALRPEDLPVDLPATMAFDAGHDRPEPPLEKAPEDWLYVTLDGKRYKRETNTMPQWAGSCWYYLRFLDPHNARAPVDPAVEKAWMPVDLYVGGAEHAVLHLLYARFWHKVLFDRGYVSTLEPFQKLVNQGMILGETEFTAYEGRAVYSGRATGGCDEKPDGELFVLKPPEPSASRAGRTRCRRAAATWSIPTRW